MGESSAVTAQRLANQTNQAIAQQSNLFDYMMFKEQNQWNLERRDEEWAYNDPSAQMERLIKAGVNPVFAAGQITGGEASPLTSAGWSGAHQAEVKPEYDIFEQQRLGNILAGSRDIVNAGLGFGKLGLLSEDVDTRRAAQLTRSELDKASAADLRAAALGRELSNKWNLSTFDTRVHQESQKLANLEGQLKNLNASTEQYQAKSLEIQENKKLITENINSVIAGIRQRDRELDIMQQHAHSNRINAAANQQNAETNRQNFQLADERFTAELKNWNNERLMQYMYKFGKSVSGQVDGSVGSKVAGFHLGAKGSLSTVLPATLANMKACGIEVMQRAADNPTPSSLSDAEKVAPILQDIDDEMARRIQGYVRPFVQGMQNPEFDIGNASVLNPSGF